MCQFNVATHLMEGPAGHPDVWEAVDPGRWLGYAQLLKGDNYYGGEFKLGLIVLQLV